MATLQKFLFDTDFGELERPVSVIEEELLEPEEEVPTFTEVEVEAARQEGFAAGHQHGLGEAVAGIESQTSGALETISSQLGGLFGRQVESNETLSADALNLVMSIARRLLPDLNAKNGLGEVTRVSQDLLERLLTEPRVEIRVNESLSQPLSDVMMPFLEQRGFKGDLVILGENDIRVGECRLAWSSGSADRDIDRLWEGIETAVEESLLTQRAMEEADPPAASYEQAIAQSGDQEHSAAVDAPEGIAVPQAIEMEPAPQPEATLPAVAPATAPSDLAEDAGDPPVAVEDDAISPARAEDTPPLEEFTTDVISEPVVPPDLDLSEATTSLDLSEPAPIPEPDPDADLSALDGEVESAPASVMGPPILEPLDGYDPHVDDDIVPVTAEDQSNLDADMEQNDPLEGGQ